MSVRKAVRPYHQPAGGWGALKALGEHLVEQGVAIKGAATLSRMNQPDGIDCPGCAWPDPKSTSSFEFCENGAKAVTWEATAKRVGPDFFAEHSVTALWGNSPTTGSIGSGSSDPSVALQPGDRSLRRGQLGRGVRRHRVAPQCAGPSGRGGVLHIGSDVQRGGVPVPAVRAPVRHQQFSRLFEHVPRSDWSVGLPKSIGVGKATVTLEDFDHADSLILSMGHNPGTNHPRMMTPPGAMRRVGERRSSCSIRCANDRSNASLSPQHPVEMATLSSTPIASK